jgi:hypothetical protein
MARSHKYLEPDARGRLALGTMLRHDMYLVQQDAAGIITLTPAAVTPLSTPPPVRKRRVPKKAAPKAVAEPQEGEPE